MLPYLSRQPTVAYYLSAKPKPRHYATLPYPLSQGLTWLSRGYKKGASALLFQRSLTSPSPQTLPTLTAACALLWTTLAGASVSPISAHPDLRAKGQKQARAVQLSLFFFFFFLSFKSENLSGGGVKGGQRQSSGSWQDENNRKNTHAQRGRLTQTTGIFFCISISHYEAHRHVIAADDTHPEKGTRP